MSENPYKKAASRPKVVPGGAKPDETPEIPKVQDEVAEVEEKTATNAEQNELSDVDSLKEAAVSTREQILGLGMRETKVPCNLMIPPSLKKKMERDVKDKKFKSMSYLVTFLLEEYYK